MPKQLRTRDEPADSDSQAMTALGATCGNHLAATLGSHANQKTVGALATNHRRLIRAFHDLSLMQTYAANSRLDLLARCLSREFREKRIAGLWINLGLNCRIPAAGRQSSRMQKEDFRHLPQASSSIPAIEKSGRVDQAFPSRLEALVQPFRF